MEYIKVKCTKRDLEALKLLYYRTLVILENKKCGITYRSAFKFQEGLNKIKNDLNNFNVDEYLEVLENE